MKFEEMEEKMRREKSQNRVKSDEKDNSSEDKNETDNVVSEPPRDPNEPIIDEDGQSHNIDNAVPYKSSYDDSEQTTILPSHETNYDTVTTTSSFPIIIDSAENDESNEQKTYYSLSSLPPPPRVEVESEKVEVIEIKSDGSSGHLTPLQNRS